jgi:hypothetical protein
VHDDVPTHGKVARPRQRAPPGHVGRRDKKLERLVRAVAHRYAEVFDEPQVPADLVQMTGVRQVQRVVPGGLPADRREPAHEPRLEQVADRICGRVVAVSLHGQVEPAGDRFRPEAWKLPQVWRSFRDARITGEGQQVVEPCPHPVQDGPGRREVHNGDGQVGSGSAQRPPGGQRAQQVAQSHPQPHDSDAADFRIGEHEEWMPRVSVLMPTFEQAAFLRRSVGSLLAQTMPDWELVIVDDGSNDATPQVADGFGVDPRVRYRRLNHNSGLGAALNAGLVLARAPLVCYLPSDDLYDPEHLAVLLDVFADDDDDVVLAWSGVRHRDSTAECGTPNGFPLQLVQVMHRRTADRWVERSELESDDLELLFWSRLRRRGPARPTGRVTCTWTDHPAQRHKAIRERYDGGLNVFRYRYRVSQPLRFHSTDSGCVDERALYRRFRARTMPRDDNEPAVVLVGELSYHADRVLALAERGLRLYGLWTPDGLGVDTVGPLPFGHVTELPRVGWPEAIRALRPAVVYAQLNWRAVAFAAAVRDALPDVPFVWHFKESPQRSLARGEWPRLAALCLAADAVVFSSAEERDWFELSLPGSLDPARTLVLDGSLPKADWFDGEPATRLSETDGHVHTCVLGRPLGFDADLMAALAAHHVHVHFHGLRNGPGPQGRWTAWLDRARRAAPHYLHVHPAVDPARWVSLLSRYDAGWLHRFPSSNAGDLRRATWDDLNPPARIGPLLAAGLPMLQQRHEGNIVAMDRLIAEQGVGLLYDDVDDLCAQLTDQALMARNREQVRSQRRWFTFDARTGPLVDLFRELSGGERHG